MSMEFEHLSAESREEAQLPSEERIRRIQAERWIGYARAETILDRLDELLRYPQRDRMPCLLLHATTGMGKTKLLRKFRRTHLPVFDSTVGTAVERNDPAVRLRNTITTVGEMVNRWPAINPPAIGASASRARNP
jgi:hypothetical protein